MSTRVWVVGVGMLVTKRMTVVPRIMMVPMTSDTPDSSSCNTVFMGGPPGGLRDYGLRLEPTIYKVFAVVTTTTQSDSHPWRRGGRMNRSIAGRGAAKGR